MKRGHSAFRRASAFESCIASCSGHNGGRWHESSGHVWQGRFKAFPIEQDAHLLAVLHYIEQNPMRAKLVTRAEDWRWSSARQWGDPARPPSIESGPVERPAPWLSWVNDEETPSRLQQVRMSVNRGTPFGSPAWVEGAAMAEVGAVDACWN